MDTFTNREEPGEMLHFAVFHRGLHSLLNIQKMQYFFLKVQPDTP